VQLLTLAPVQTLVTLPLACWSGGTGKLGDVDREVRAGIVAVEDVEELCERIYLPALADLERDG
jgi:hypothetical protein